EMLPSLDNYVSYGTDVVTSNSEVQARLFNIIETVMKSDRVGENDRVCACKLMEAIMLHGRSKIDGMIPGFISLAAAYLLSSDAIETSHFLVHALEVVLNALHYNPSIALTVLEQYKWTEGIFTRLLQSSSKFSRVHDKKLMILGLTAVLSIPAAQLPPALQNGLPQLFEGVLQTFRTLDTAIESREAMQRMYEGGSDDELDEEFEWDGNEDDDFEGGEDEDDDVDNYESEYLQHLASKASKALGGNTDLENSLGSDDDEDDEYDEDLDEDYSLDTPLDHIDAYLVLQDRLTEMQAHNTGTYNTIMQSLSAENGQFLQSLIAEADQKRISQANGNSQQ
ncbi:Nonsense-mediated mRNA decay protein 5, partial [Coemansia sp. RSA 2611]